MTWNPCFTTRTAMTEMLWVPLDRVFAAQRKQRGTTKTSVTGGNRGTDSPPVRDFCLPGSGFILMDFSSQGCREGGLGMWIYGLLAALCCLEVWACLRSCFVWAGREAFAGVGSEDLSRAAQLMPPLQGSIPAGCRC